MSDVFSLYLHSTAAWWSRVLHMSLSDSLCLRNLSDVQNGPTYHERGFSETTV